MTTYKDKAEKYVREQLGISRDSRSPDSWLRLNDWLRVLDMTAHKQGVIYKLCNCGVLKYGETIFHFNLTTGQPATEADYQVLCNILNI